MSDVERDDLTGKPKDIDSVKKFLRSIEQHIGGIDEASADIFQGEILELMAAIPNLATIPTRRSVRRSRKSCFLTLKQR